MRHFIYGVHLERNLHLALARKRVDEDWDLAALRLLEQQRRTALLHGPVGELRNFEPRIHREPNAFQLAFLLQRANEVAQIIVSHANLIVGRKLLGLL